MNAVIRFCLENKWIVPLFIVCITAWGVMVAPFDWKLDFLPRNPVPVDAIPDIGENQQIVFTKWPGRSPRDVEDQISYPLTVSLLGLPGVKTIRSFSYFGYSSIYIILRMKLTSTGLVPGCWRNSPVFHRVCYRTMFLPPWDRMRPPWGKSFGIRSKAVILRAIRPVAGIWTRFVASRIGTSAMRCKGRRESPKWPPSADLSKSTKSTSTPMRFGRMTSVLPRS